MGESEAVVDIPKFTTVERLTGLISALSLTPDHLEIFAVSQEATKLTADTGSPASCIEVLLKCCDTNWRLSTSVATCAVSLCQNDAVNSTDVGSFRTLWLKQLQALFLRKCN